MLAVTDSPQGRDLQGSEQISSCSSIACASKL
jgi:hypothetical protein